MGDPCVVFGTYWTGWLELALAGLVASAFVNRRLVSTQLPAKAADVRKARTRVGILVATCAASDSSWARLVRAALRDACAFGVAPESGGYRSAPPRTTSASLEKVLRAERFRLAQLEVLGLAGSMCGGLGATMLFGAQPVLMALMLVAAITNAHRVVANTKLARRALEDTFRALPTLEVGIPPAPRGLGRGARIPVRTFGLDSIPGYLFVALFAGVAVVLGWRVTLHGVNPTTIGQLTVFHALLIPLALGAFASLPRAFARIDGAREEVVFVRRLFGIPFERVIVPIEIATRFVVEGRARDVVLVEVGRERLRVMHGNRAAMAAQALNEALETTFRQDAPRSGAS